MMDFKLENKIALRGELGNGYLQEIDDKGEDIGSKQIPSSESVYFTASELSYVVNLKNDDNASEKIIKKETITGNLYSGFLTTLETDKKISYSMFGTNRIIKEFNLAITKIENNSLNEKCEIEGLMSYSFEHRFKETVSDDDEIKINIYLHSENFDKISAVIKLNLVNYLFICLKNVSGFYSEEYPFKSSELIKVLTKYHTVSKPDNFNIQLLVLGEVGEFHLQVANKITNLKQKMEENLSGSLTDNLISENNGEIAVKGLETSITHQLIINEQTLKKIKIPLWLIFICLCLMTIKFVFQ